MSGRLTTKIFDDPDDAAACVRAGGLCAFPTETVFGLGVDACDRQAAERIFQAKGRPSDNPLIVHLADQAAWSTAASCLTDSGALLLQSFSPGPCTVVLPKHPDIADCVTGGLDTVGIRIPSDTLARRFLRAVGRPVAAPSANLSGKPSCTTWQAVLEDMEGRIDGLLRGVPSTIGLESTVVDCTGDTPILLRQGSITIGQLRVVVPNIRMLPHLGCSDADAALGFDSGSGTSMEAAARSPGLRHPHYQPNARVVLITSVESLASVPDVFLEGRTVFLGLHSPANQQQFAHCQLFDSVEAYAMGFYEALRQADRDLADCIVIEAAPNESVGAALLDRQRRAAGLA